MPTKKPASVPCYMPAETKEKFREFCKKKKRSMAAQLLILVEDFMDIKKNPNGRSG